jgi:hypothetical protein
VAEPGTGFAVGGGFTVVDTFLVLLYCWARRLEMIFGGGGGEGMVYPDYAGYTRRILGRESVRRTTEVHVDV